MKLNFLNQVKANFKTAIKILKETNQLTRFILIILLIGATFLTVFLVQKKQSYLIKATAHQATIFFVPETSSLPPDKSFKLFINPQTTPLVFAHLEVNFDPQLIKLVETPSPSTNLNRLVAITPIQEANTTGVLILALAANPQDPLPSESFELAVLHFTPVTPDSNTTKVTINPNSSLLVSQDEQLFTLTTTPLILDINPVPSPSPTPISSPTPTPVPTSNQSPFFVTRKLSSAKANKSYSKSIVAADKDLNDVLYIEVSNLPLGFDLVNCQTTTNKKKKRLEISCNLTGSSTSKGSYDINLTVIDSKRDSAAKIFTLNVR